MILGPEMPGKPETRNRRTVAIMVLGLLACTCGINCSRQNGTGAGNGIQAERPSNYTGSTRCRECHEKFYLLWSTSHHGKAMQPVTMALVGNELSPLATPLRIGQKTFEVNLPRKEMIETGPAGRRNYPMLHALGGKNVFFFLTQLDRGRLQVLPLSYDINRKEWFDTTRSMVRHFGDITDEAIDWLDPLLTFNTACYNCHVSQLDKNYNRTNDTYQTTWREPGINCETCHGPGEEHIRLCKSVPAGTKPGSLGLIGWKPFTREQVNDSCAPCHAKMRAVSPSFTPGDRYFDNFDLSCMEDRDFYPDGRDLGENYTYTGWLMNPCVRAGALDCMHCHTSSGRYRFKDNDPNGACLPCHEKRVSDAQAHTHHQPGTNMPQCISCHMPMTEFSRMRRSDHSLRPPSPGAGVRFESPNACNLCHTNQTPQWAADTVRAWYPDSKWQPLVLRQGELVDYARKGNWAKLPEIIAFLSDTNSDPVVTTSLLRLLASCPDARKWDAIRRCAGHSSPLVRSSVADLMSEASGTSANRVTLLNALRDDYRLVRVRAVATLARIPREGLPPADRLRLDAAERELLASFESQPDNWSSRYNLGNYRSDRGDPAGALAAYDQSIALRNDIAMPYVNASVVASQTGSIADSIKYLQAAYRHLPEHPAVNLNLGLALAEAKQLPDAEKHLRVALKSAETRAQAAYNLAVLVAARNPTEAIELCGVAVKADPQNPRNAWTQAFYLDANNRTDEAIPVLRALIEHNKDYADGWFMLGDCLIKTKRIAEAKTHFQGMANEPALPAEVRSAAMQRLVSLSSASN